MKGKKRNVKKSLFLLAVFMTLLLGSVVMVHASANVPQGQGAVSITSKKNGWQKVGGYWYYYKNKRLQRGWLELSNRWYYLRANGRMITGMKWINGKKYYFNPIAGSNQGRMYAGTWKKVSGRWYYFQKNGSAVVSDWKKLKGKWYYFNKSGIMQTGWVTVKGKRYYLYTDGHMAANTWIGNNWVGASGAMTPKAWRNGSGDHRVYSSNTLNVNLYRKNNGYTTYWVARVKTRNSSQLRSALSYGSYGGARQKTSSAVSANGGIIGINGSAFDYGNGRPSPLGMCIKNGRVYGNYATSYSVMAVKKDGTIFTPRQGLWAQSLLNMGVKDTYNFGPILINNGVVQEAWAETRKYYPRVAVGMIRKNDYVLLCCNGNGVKGSRGLNHWEMADIFRSYGCQYAYNLDGGGSATLYYNGVVMNNPSDGAERPCADFLYFTN